MNESKLETIEQVREFLAGTADVAFAVPTDEAKLRTLVVTVLRRFRYFSLAKDRRGILFAYMLRLTGYSRQHLRTSCLTLSNEPKADVARYDVLLKKLAMAAIAAMPMLMAVSNRVAEVPYGTP